MASSWMVPEKRRTRVHLCFWKRPAASTGQEMGQKQPVWFSLQQTEPPVSCVWRLRPCLLVSSGAGLCATLGAISPHSCSLSRLT